MPSTDTRPTATDRRPPRWLSLTGSERVLWTGRPSAYLIRRRLAAGASAFLLGIAGTVALPPSLGWLGWVLVGVAILLAAAAYVDCWAVRYVVTSHGVYKRRGILRRTIETLPLASVQTLTLTQSVGQRVVGCGHVRVRTAATGAGPLVLEHVRTPNDVVALVTDRLDAADTDPGGPTRRRVDSTGNRPDATGS